MVLVLSLMYVLVRTGTGALILTDTSWEYIRSPNTASVLTDVSSTPLLRVFSRFVMDLTEHFLLGGADRGAL